MLLSLLLLLPSCNCSAVASLDIHVTAAEDYLVMVLLILPWLLWLMTWQHAAAKGGAAADHGHVVQG